MRRDDAFTSKYLKGSDLGSSTVVVTVASVEMVDISMEDSPTDMKCVMHFVGKDKGMIVNPTNWDLVELFLGSEDTDNWIGKTLLLWSDPTISYKGKLTGGLRFKGAGPGTAPAATPAPAPGPSQGQDPSDEIPF